MIDGRPSAKLVLTSAKQPPRTAADFDRAVDRPIDVDGGLRFASRMGKFLDRLDDLRNPDDTLLGLVDRLGDIGDETIEVRILLRLGCLGERFARIGAQKRRGSEIAIAVDDTQKITEGIAQIGEIAADELHRRVDLMGDTAGHRAQGFEPLRPLQVLFQRLLHGLRFALLREIPQDPDLMGGPRKGPVG